MSKLVRNHCGTFGLDVDGMVDLYGKRMGNVPLTPEEEAMLSENMREGTFNFVNDAVALPQSQNRPLIYQDPRFALFTQFQGFHRYIYSESYP